MPAGDKEILERKIFSRSQTILKQGQEGADAYLIETGKVRVFMEKDGRMIDLAELGPGQIFGEMALIAKKPAGAWVQAMEDTAVQVITPELLQSRIEASDPMIRSLVLMLMDRMERTNRALMESESREYMDIAFV